MSDFLENLKNAADNGTFNSEAAKKILEINELADKKLGAGTPADLEKLQESLDKRVEGNGEIKEPKEQAAAITKEDVEELNSRYELKMADLKKQDAVNIQVATLIEFDDIITATVGDLLSFTADLKEKFGEEFEKKNPMFADLLGKINEMNMKYNNSIINN